MTVATIINPIFIHGIMIIIICLIRGIRRGKTIFFISRNKDSPSIFHGSSELIYALSKMELFNKNPENIRIIFIESMTLKNDPFYDMYRSLISRGYESIYIKNLKKKYHISSIFHVPINLVSPAL